MTNHKHLYFNKKLGLLWLFLCTLLLCPFLTIRAQAATEKAYLYFFTIDGEQVDTLSKKVSKKTSYMFKNPDPYKYLPIEEDGDEPLYPELYYQVTGIEWEEKDASGKHIATYKEGDTFEWSEGDHFFYVKSDNPILTGENTMDLTWEERVHLYFYNVNGDEIYSLAKDISPKDEFTFADPAPYTYWFESGEDAEGEEDPSDTLHGTGIYWYCMDEKDKEYLFASKDKARFRPGVYEFYIMTDDPVQISFYYPINYDTYYTADDMSGAIYASLETKVGETIQFKKSLGALLWESTFKGWTEENHDQLYRGGASFKIMKNQDLNFFAEYEYDENWDPDALDQNTGQPAGGKEAEEEINIADIEKINEAAGAGYGVAIDANGILRNTGNRVRINSSLGEQMKGIPGTIKSQKSLSSLKPGGDPNNPADYKKDKYGNKIEDSKLPVEINNVLRQDDSAMYMDVYGNAFVYYSQLTRDNNMRLAYDRLTLGKTDSWVKNTSNWDAGVIERFEAIEFALLKGKYPKNGEVLIPEVKNESGDVIQKEIKWKTSYMSKLAFDRLKPFKQIWNGWYDTYDDGLLEKYKGTSNSGNGDTIVVGKALRSFTDLFTTTAYAADNNQKNEKNSMGIANQSNVRIQNSMDLKNTKFKPQYYVPTKTFAFGSFSFNSLDGLSQEAIMNMTTVFNAIVSAGYTPEFAAGACGNMWQESNFNPKAVSASGTFHGIVQWGGGRFERLKQIAAENNSTWDSLDIQIKLILEELNSSTYSSSFVRNLKRYNGQSDVKGIADVQTACDLWARVIEGCVCSANHPVTQCPIVNGDQFQELAQRRIYAQKISMAMRSTGSLTIDANGYGVPNNLSNNKVPYFPQGSNAPWSGLAFGDKNIAYSGCSITSLSMVVSYHTGQFVYPSDIRQSIMDHNGGNYKAFHVAGAGASNAIYSAVASYYGLKCKYISSATEVTAALQRGLPVIISVKGAKRGAPTNTFTSNAHLMVITGMDAAGNYYINNPSKPNQCYERYSLSFIMSHKNSGMWVLSR